MKSFFGLFTNRTIFVVTAVLLIGGCATGSKVRLSDAALSGDPSAMWEEGQKFVATGEDLVAKGEKGLKDGRKDVR